MKAKWAFTVHNKESFSMNLSPFTKGEVNPDTIQWMQSTISARDIIINKLPGNLLVYLKKIFKATKKRAAIKEIGPIIM